MVRGLPRIALAPLLCALALIACSGGGTIPAVPPGLDLKSVPWTSVAVTAENFQYTPELVRVKQGTMVEFTITSAGGTHGFAFDDYGIDETVEEGKTVKVLFYAGEKGEFGFHCSHFCGLGHFGMNGTLVVE